MGLTISNIDRSAMANKNVVFFDVAFDTSYPTGGESLTAGNVGLSKIQFLLAESKAGLMFEYDYANSKLKAIYPRAAVTGTLAAAVAEGATPVTSTAANGAIITLTGNPAVAAGAGAEVGNAVDLVAVTGVKVMAVGY